MDSPFDVLGVDPDADEAEIVESYRERVKEAHPDQGGSVSEFRAVRTAYERIQAGYGTEEYDPEREGIVEQRQPGTQVEYIDYAILDDYAWDVDDESLFEKAADEGLDPADGGRFRAPPDETLLEAAEDSGHAWPYACRGGACANCAVAVLEGELEMPSNHVLSSDMIERGLRLSCIGTPTTDEMKVVYNVKHLPDLDELRLPPRQFGQAHSDD
ncbi:ferredoxin Fer [Halomicrococcus sp. NG-SE-24]|uniref:ferredoxin Fer n=1 Tax=Halomicrococcus sp. NG-SE-24 TaxID=3436928 RepID=UPI003D98E397